MHHEELARLRARAIRALATGTGNRAAQVRGGLGNQEIGQVLRLRPGHVAVILFRALHKLRVCLENEVEPRHGDAER